MKSIPIGCTISVPDAVGQKLRVNGRIWYFNFSERFGPFWAKKNGNLRKNQNPPKAVWDAFDKWHKNWRNERTNWRDQRTMK